MHKYNYILKKAFLWKVSNVYNSCKFPSISLCFQYSLKGFIIIRCDVKVHCLISCKVFLRMNQTHLSQISNVAQLCYYVFLMSKDEFQVNMKRQRILSAFFPDMIVYLTPTMRRAKTTHMRHNSLAIADSNDFQESILLFSLQNKISFKCILG